MRYGKPNKQNGVFGRALAVMLGAALVVSPTSPLATAASSSLTSDGALDVSTNPPGAVVYVDGTFAGHTPLTIDSLSAGEHRIRIMRDGYLENSRTVTVESGLAKAVEVRLTPDANAGAAGAAAVRRAPGDSIFSNPIFWAAVAGGGAAAVLLSRGGNKAPSIGSAAASPMTGLAGATSINFSAQGASDPDGDAMTFSWDFGDGAMGTGQSASHVYANAGNYTATVRVSDGEDSAQANTTVTIRDLTGTWDGDFFPGAVLTLTQNGSTITGTYMDIDGPGTITGFVQSGSPQVTITIDQPPFSPFTFIGDPDGNINVLSGDLFGPATLTRR